MPEEHPPSEPPQPSPHPWAPPDQPSARPSDAWLPVDPQPWGSTAPSAATHPYGGEPAADAHRPRPAQRQRLRRVVIGATLAVALFVGGGVGIAVSNGDGPAGEARDEPTADRPWQDRGNAEAAAEASPTPSAAPATTPSTGPGRISVVYEVTGRGRADVLYSDANGEPVWVSGAQLPWRKIIRTDHRDQVMVQVGRTDATTGEQIACSLAVDGEAPVTEEVDGHAWRASCFG
ncbi:MmpS family transport accessory protein [Micromonospora costi]|uniref:MmpS family transport accessory protein n=1 Tax=Micromonospora costi TaxID=1530042 RepID=UPI0033EE1DF0